jgi:hypothetical protein
MPARVRTPARPQGGSAIIAGLEGSAPMPSDRPPLSCRRLGNRFGSVVRAGVPAGTLGRPAETREMPKKGRGETAVMNRQV